MKLNLFLAAYKSGSELNPKIVILDTYTQKEIYSGTYRSLAICAPNYNWIGNTIFSWDLQDNVLTIELYKV